jgi:hypothetical protein
MSDPIDLYDEVFQEMLSDVKSRELSENETAAAIKNLRVFSECRPPASAPEPEPTPEPTTFWGKVKAGATGVWDNETTRVLIKAGGAFAGVAVVTWTTIHRDHVIERQAMSQANQRNS